MPVRHYQSMTLADGIFIQERGRMSIRCDPSAEVADIAMTNVFAEWAGCHCFVPMESCERLRSLPVDLLMRENNSLFFLLFGLRQVGCGVSTLSSSKLLLIES